MITIRVRVRWAGAVGLALALAALPQSGLARQSPPSTLDQLEWYLGVGVPPESILERVRLDCLAFPVDAEAERRLRDAGATDEFLASLRSVCQGIWEVEVDLPMWVQLQPPAVGSSLLYQPRSAALKSLALPGLGQIATGRPGAGALFMAGWAGALGVGILTREVTVECVDRVDGSCPPDRVLGKRTERPFLAAGVGTAVALAALSAWEAWSGAKRANTRRVASAEGPSLGSFSVELLPASPGGGAATLDLARLRFRWLGGQGPIAAATGRAERSTVQVETPEPTLNAAAVDSLRVRLVEISDQVRLADFTWAFEILEEVGAGIAGLQQEFAGVPAVAELDREYLAAYRATWARCDLVRRIMLERGEGNPPVCRQPPRGGGDDRS